ncbi:MAG: hypothetical protein ACR2N2_07880 [Acidimicrobiia bacterium]
MEAWDDGQRVRPIPIEDDDVVEDVSPKRVRGDAPRRPWLPLAIAASAVVVVMASVAGFGALRFDEPPTTPPDAFTAGEVDADGSTTTAAPLPPRLDESIPGITDRLTLIAENDKGLWTLLWDPAFREPKAVSLGIEPDLSGPGNIAMFDRGGRFIALETCLPAACSLYVGLPADPGVEADLINVGGWVWHGTEVGRLAWTELVETETVIRTASVNPLSSSLEDVTVAMTVPGIVELAHWDASGFILRNAETTAYDPSGNALWSISGVFPTSATTSIVSLVDEGFVWTLVDRLTGERTEHLDVSGSAEDSRVWLTTSESTDLVAKVAEGVSGSQLTVVSGSLNAPRLVSIKQGFDPLRFTENGQFFVFVNTNATTLAFVDWRTGASYEVDAPANYRVVGFYLG